MPKFQIDDTVGCLVTWRYEIEAATEEAALAEYQSGNHVAEAIIGDSIEYVPQNLEIKALP
jgi:hypothetical protein